MCVLQKFYTINVQCNMKFTRLENTPLPLKLNGRSRMNITSIKDIWSFPAPANVGDLLCRRTLTTLTALFCIQKCYTRKILDRKYKIMNTRKSSLM